MTNSPTIRLRKVKDSDLENFFDHQQDPTAQKMAAFVHKDPTDRNAFDAHWIKIRSNQETIIKTILYDDQLVGHIAKFVMFEKPELTYWIDKLFWGKGIATQALLLFLD
ncbi:MAG: GNAT family N-acetyltransferase, partial [Candidatus Heimdallarchaeota archaeon]|nr:GNAT family N-acetyltransferase [Candidatus Heimdallarchaeota archaeon]